MAFSSIGLTIALNTVSRLSHASWSESSIAWVVTCAPLAWSCTEVAPDAAAVPTISDCKASSPCSPDPPSNGRAFCKSIRLEVLANLGGNFYSNSNKYMDGTLHIIFQLSSLTGSCCNWWTHMNLQTTTGYQIHRNMQHINRHFTYHIDSVLQHRAAAFSIIPCKWLELGMRLCMIDVYTLNIYVWPPHGG